MTFVTHGLMGSALLTAPVRSSPVWVKWILGLTGLVLGMAPDVLAWYYSVIYATGRWEFYACFHENMSWWILALPPYGLHVFLDSFTHGPDGWYWWAYILEPILGAGSLWALAWIWWDQLCIKLPDDFDLDLTEEDIRKPR